MKPQGPSLETFFLVLTDSTKRRLLDYGYDAVSRIMRREEALRRQIRRELAAQDENAQIH